MQTSDWISLIQTFGLPVVMLVLVLVLGVRKVWVWGYQLEESERRAAKWEEMALRGTRLAEEGTDIADDLTRIAHRLKEAKK